MDGTHMGLGILSPTLDHIYVSVCKRIYWYHLQLNVVAFLCHDVTVTWLPRTVIICIALHQYALLMHPIIYCAVLYVKETLSEYFHWTYVQLKSICVACKF